MLLLSIATLTSTIAPPMPPPSLIPATIPPYPPPPPLHADTSTPKGTTAIVAPPPAPAAPSPPHADTSAAAWDFKDPITSSALIKSSISTSCDDGGNPAPTQLGGSVPAVLSNGIYFTWASPCSGGCSTTIMPSGWRECTTTEWNSLPTNADLQAAGCGAPCFDPSHDHCDWTGTLVRVPDNNYNELVRCGYNGPVPSRLAPRLA